jgi:hypothetical protein
MHTSINPAATLPAAYVGVWKGTASQGGIIDYPVVLNILMVAKEVPMLDPVRILPSRAPVSSRC